MTVTTDRDEWRIRAALAGERTPTARTGPATAWHALQPFALPDELRGKAGKPRVEAALLRLHTRGEIRRETERDQQRRLREVWRLGDDDDVPL